MKTHMATFSSVAMLRNAPLDLKALRKDGRLKVGDEVYTVTAGQDGALGIKDSKAKEFFSYVSNHLSNHKERSSQTRKEVARILVEKQQSAAQELRAAISARDGGPDVQIESAVSWAQRCKDPQDKHKVYHAYSGEAPGLPPMEKALTQVFFETLTQLGKSRSVRLRHQSHDGNKEAFNIEKFLKDQPNIASLSFYRFEGSKKSFSVPSNSRLTINVKPQYASDLLKALVKITRESPSVAEGKIAAPEDFGQRTDCAILYMQGDYDAGLKVAELVRQALPEDAFVNHTPGCMHRIADGISYAERAPEDSASHGKSRTEVIHQALTLQSEKPLKEKLAAAFKKAGYHPQFPAFRLGSLG